jgi:hypothetical protein
LVPRMVSPCDLPDLMWLTWEGTAHCARHQPQQPNPDNEEEVVSWFLRK